MSVVRFRRFRQKLIRRVLVAAGAACVLLLVLSDGAAAAGRTLPSASRGANWLVRGQQENGAFFSSADMTAVTLAAIVAGGIEGDPVDRALDYIEANGQARATNGGLTGRIIAGIVAGGADPRNFGGVDYVSILSGQYNPVTGEYDSDDFISNLEAANGALAANETLPEAAVDYVLSHECPDGGFGSQNSQNQCESNVEATAWAINVLVAAGHGSTDAVSGATDYLRSAQNEDGGVGHAVGMPTTADSTGLAISAIWAVGQGPTLEPWKRPDGSNPAKALANLQDDNGGFRTTSSDSQPNAVSTVKAVPAAAREAYPIPPQTPDPPKSETRSNGPAKRTADDEDEGGDEQEAAVAVEATEAHAASEAPSGAFTGAAVKSSRVAAPRQEDKSYSRPSEYEDPTLGSQLFAVGSLITSIVMVGSGFWLFRYTRLR